MKKQKFSNSNLFSSGIGTQKYTKKYCFLQNSLFDFLYWRSCNFESGQQSRPNLLSTSYFSCQNKSTFSDQKIKMNSQSVNFQNSKQTFSFLNEENIYLSQYWKSTDIKKGNHVFQNLNKNISVSFDQQVPLSGESLVQFDLKRKKNQNDRFQKFEKLKTKTQKKTKFSKFQSAQTRQNRKNDSLLVFDTLVSSKQQSVRSQKKPQKQKIFSFESNTQSFIPKTHFLQTLQNLQFVGPLFCFFYSSFLPASQIQNSLKRQSQIQTTNTKVGAFFPNKKNFQQYWVFPLVGFVLLYCTQSSFLKFSQTEKPLNKPQKISFFEISKIKQTFSKSFPTELQMRNNTIPNFQYSYANQNLKNFYRNFQKIEKNEFEHFSNFYSKILQKSFSSFAVDQTRSFLFEWFPQFPIENSEKQNQFLKDNFYQNFVKQNIDRNRNCFAWKWYSLFSNNQKNFLGSFENQQIPQKAQFFGVLNCPFETQNTNSTPLTDFSKSLFLLNEFDKTFSFFEKSFQNSSLSMNFQEISNFFKNSTKEEFLFLNSLNSNRISQKTNIFSELFSTGENLNKKSLFLKNWLNTTNGFIVIPSSRRAQKQKNQSKVEKNFTTENFQFLDSIYCQKILRKNKKQFNSFENLKTMKKNNSIIHQLFFNGSSKNCSSFQNFRKNSSQERLSFFPEKKTISTSPFFAFKKQTFQFFSVQSLKNNLNQLKNSSDKSKFSNFLKEKSREINQNSFPIVFDQLKTPLKFCIFEKNTKNSFLKNNISFNKEKTPEFSITRLSFPIICDFSNLQHMKQKNFFSSQTDEKQFFEYSTEKSSFQTKKTNFETSISFQKNNLNQKKNEYFTFVFSKFSPFETISEKFFQKLQAKKFFTLFSFDVFQYNFFFEKQEKKNAITFQTRENYETLFASLNSFGFSTKKQNSFFKKPSADCLKASGSFIFKFKSHKIHREHTNSKTSRKFEKVFQTFFSPLNSQNSFSNLFSFEKEKNKKSQSTFETKQEKLSFFSKYDSLRFFFTKEKTRKTKSKKVLLKLQNDKFLLQTLSKSFSPLFHSDFVYLKTFKPAKSNVSPNENKSRTYDDLTNIFSNGTLNKNFQKIEKKEKFAPEFVMKRDGFVIVPNDHVFANSFFSERNNVKNNFSSTFSNSLQLNLERFEKEKSIQKKRRLKKQKLETRRRKKRKRFFPRPVWLRFHLYKKFLKIRHPLHTTMDQNIKTQNLNQNLSTNLNHIDKMVLVSPEKQNLSSLSNVEFFCEQKEEKNSLQKRNHKTFSLENSFFNTKSTCFSGFLKNSDILTKTKLYGKNTKKTYFYWKNGLSRKNTYTKIGPFHDSNRKAVISTNPNHYKISGDILSEFLRLSWKSYWFQTNYQPYTYRISQNLKTMLQVESQKNFNFRDFFGTFKYSVFFENVPGFFSFDQDFIVQKSLFKKFLVYSNIRNSIESNPVEKNSFDFQKIQNIPEYNRILYARVSELIGRFKFSENNEKAFSLNSKPIKRKDDKLFSHASIFTKSALFFEKFHVPSQPSIPAFSLFSSLFHDWSMKPTGDMATLRSLWAFQKTNVFHFQETNRFRNLWTFQKRMDSLKSFKATKKILHFFSKHSEIEKLNTFSSSGKNTLNSNTLFEKGDLVDFVAYSNEKWKKKRQFVQKSNFLITIDFQNKIKGARENYFQNLDNFSFQKFQNIEKKCSLFGLRSFKQNSKFCLRYLKFHLLSNRLSSFQNKDTNSNFGFFKHGAPATTNAKNFYCFPFEKNSTWQNSAQSSLNFWWAQKNWSSKDFFYSNEQFFDPSFLNSSLSNVFQQKNKWFSVQIQFLFFSTFVFHLAIFLTLLKIPEVRSVFKFQSLVFYKILHCFFGIFFAIHNLFQKYTEKSLKVFQMLFDSKTNQFLFSDGFGSDFKTEKMSKPQFSVSQNFLLSDQNASFLFSGASKENPFVYSFFLRFSGIPFGKKKKQQKRNKQKPFLSESSKQKQSETYDFFFFEKGENFSVFSETKTNRKTKKMQLNFDFSNSKFQNKSLIMKNQTKLKNLVSSFQLSEKNFQKDFSIQRSSLFTQKKAIVFVSPKFGTFQYFLKVFSTRDGEKKEKELFSQMSSSLSSAKHIGTHTQSFQKMKVSEKIAFEIALSVLFFGKRTTLVGYNIVQIGSNVSAKIFEVIEAILFSIYKFLEKPAELMIEWIALLFLIEWSSDIATFVPDTLDTTFWKTSQKIIRQTRSSSLFFNTFNASQTFSGLNSLFFFHSSNVVTYILQKRMLYFVEHFFSSIIQPDIDILIRQKKGMIFWDIWAEILLKAAEKYNVNIPSFVTLKEEQELFIEKFLQDREFFQNLQVDQSGKGFASFLQNFLVVNRPEKLFDPNFVKSFISPGFSNTQLCSNVFSSIRQAEANIHNGKKNSLFFVSGEKNQNTVREQKRLLYLKRNIFSISNIGTSENQFSFSSELDRWACNQYGTYQGSETDLFIDIHPSKSLKNIHFLKYYEPAQYTLGSIICQIYAGLFPKQVSKNILVIGAPGTAKTLFIQALAGETEMKIITDNAYRYAMVQRGVAVGMKYLRDVFDAIALQTPCFFLLEHIHVIGSKRPLLISDDENVKGNQSSFGLEQQEVHETNQMVYQSSRHSISDFKRPYKGDFSMGIATNFFIENFTSLETNTGSIFQNSQFSGQNFSSFGSFVQSPLPIDSIESSLNKQGFAENSNETSFSKTRIQKIQTSLQFSKEQIFAPPATSPFTVLMMKEQKKLKPKKIVKEISWGGLSADQIVSYQKETYSIRAKVAALADITMNLSRGKLDMITDLLVIIDSVRSNRGFVVFGTTHVPSLLDPALRRPGRFDETLSLAQSPNFLNRFEILRINFENSISTLDFLDSSIFTENLSEMKLFSLITETKLSFFHQYKYTEFEKTTPYFSKNSKTNQFRIFSQLSPTKAFQIFLKSSFFHDLYDQKSSVFVQKKLQNQLNSNLTKKQQKINNQSSSFFYNSKRNFTIFPKGPSHTLTLAYSQIGIFLARANFYKDPRSFTPLSLDKNKLFLKENFREFVTCSLYEQQKVQKLQLMVFLSGKITEFFVQKNEKFSTNQKPNQNSALDSTWLSVSESEKRTQKFNSNDFFQRKFSFFSPLEKTSGDSFENFSAKSLSNVVGFVENEKTKIETIQKPNFFKKDFFWTAFGNDQSWRSATPFLFALVQKRLFFTKNLLLSKMLLFDNNNQRRQPPSPPNSSILMPSKKYENYKRTQTDFFQKARFSINEKIQMHQKQRFLKQLYNIPVQKYFRSEIVQKRQTFFSSSFQELAYVDSLTRRSSSSQFYHQKYLGFRHSFSHINQWWNGMLPEHNAETTYLSDVDWRTIFIKRKSNSSTHSSETLEFTMDFPDAEQYYNPRNRRWYLNTKNTDSNSLNNSNYWLTFDLNLQYEIYYHFLMQSFHQSFEYFDNQREMIDFYVYHLLNKGLLTEVDFLNTFSRFQIKQ